MYTVICDNCGKDSNEDSDYSCWNDRRAAIDTAFESGFQEIEGKHICPNCYDYDDNDDIFIKPTP